MTDKFVISGITSPVIYQQSIALATAYIYVAYQSSGSCMNIAAINFPSTSGWFLASCANFYSPINIIYDLISDKLYASGILVYSGSNSIYFTGYMATSGSILF